MKKFLEFYNEKKRACKEFFEGQQKAKKSSAKDPKSKKEVILVNQDYKINLSEIVNQKKIKKRFVTFKINLNSEIELEACVVENNKTVMTVDNNETVTVPVNKEQNVELKIIPKVESSQLGDIELGLKLGKSKINYNFTAYRFDLNADLNKGQSAEDHAVLLNYDTKTDSSGGATQAKGLGEVNIRKFGPSNYPENIKLMLELKEKDAEKIKLFPQEDTKAKTLIGEGKRCISIEENMFKNNTLKLYAQALEHQDKKFDGFIDLGLNFAAGVDSLSKKEKVNPFNITFFVEPKAEKPKVHEPVLVKEIPKETSKAQEPVKTTATAATTTKSVDMSSLSLVKQAEQIVRKVCAVEAEATPGYLSRNNISVQDKRVNGIAKRRKDQKRRANLDMAFKIPRDMDLAVLPSFGQHLSNFSYNLHSRSSSRHLHSSFRDFDAKKSVSHFSKYSSSVR